MVISLTGSSGFIGKALSLHFILKGFTVIPISREMLYPNSEKLIETIEQSDVVINLAGSPILSRWTETNKQNILSSRINTTKKIVDAINSCNKKPELFISASAIGIYNDSDTWHNESSTDFSSGFIYDVVSNWETEALKITSEKTRIILARISIVLSKTGGAFPKMYRPFKLGFGGKIGNGKQGFSFIHLDDFINSFLFLINNQKLTGIVNIVSPKPVSNKEFTDLLSRISHKPSFFTVPSFALKLLYGEGASVLLQGQKVIPQKLLENGFEFKFKNLESVLKNILQ